MTARYDRSSAGTRWWPLLVGFAFHAPGLWLFFRRPVPAAARRENLVAVLLTLISIAVTAWLLADWVWVAAVWLAGHLAWGARLAWHLDRDARDT